MPAARPDVCLVCPFDLGRSSGTPNRARATAESLRGHASVHILATSDAAGAERVAGAISERRAQVSIHGWVRGTFLRLRALRPRVAHCFTPLAALPALLARRVDGGLRVVLEFHGPAEYELAHARRSVRVSFTELDRATVRASDAVLAMSTQQRAYLLDRFATTSPVVVSWGPVDVGAIDATPAAYERPLRFGYFGNANFWQGLDGLLEATRLCAEEPVRLVIAGADRTGALPACCESLGVLERGAMLAAMGTCDVLVSPRRGGRLTELQYPFKLSAYLAAGRPILGTDVNDQGHIIRTTGCGLAVPPDRPDALAAAMHELARAPAGRLREMGVAARRFAEANLGYASLRRQLSAAYRMSL